jgi:6,7-dimethyl-8-ribityllumazine synthase
MTSILLVHGMFYTDLAAALRAGAVAALEDSGFRLQDSAPHAQLQPEQGVAALAVGVAGGGSPLLNFHEIYVPGALEIPQVIRYAIASGRYDGYVALGTVIRGETGHYDIVAGESSRALMDLSLQFQAPIGNGILTVENDEQAWERADPKRKDKGGDAVRAVLALLEAKQTLERAAS